MSIDKAKHIDGVADMVATAMTKTSDYRDLAYIMPAQGLKYIGEPNKTFTASFCQEINLLLREYADILRNTSMYSEDQGIDDTEVVE